jgi:hypothetical protein
VTVGGHRFHLNARGVVAALVGLLVCSMVATAPGVSGQHAAGMWRMRGADGSTRSTPVPGRDHSATTSEADPLDGDPLDGAVATQDSDAPTDHLQLEVVRSGRPNDAPRSLAAYDGNPKTVWRPGDGANDAWLWLDLGGTRRVRDLRWLTTGGGDVRVTVSRDRRHWHEVHEARAATGWRGVALHQETRYVRLELLPGDDGQVPALAEVAVYGADQPPRVSAEQSATGNGKRNRKRQRASQNAERGGRNESTASDSNEPQGESERRAGGRVTMSAEAGETGCRGDRARCRAQRGDVSVEEGADRNGSYTIDIRADGGSAECDASGGERTRAGNGRGKRGADGGRCEATANGGAVAVGDVNP